MQTNSIIANLYAGGNSGSSSTKKAASGFDKFLSDSSLALTAGDEVSQSQLISEMLDRIGAIDVFDVIFNDKSKTRTKTLEEVGADFAEDFANFQSLFNEYMGPLNLDPDKALTMGLDGKGGVKVTQGDAQSAGQVNEVFAKNSVLVSRFAVMAARGAILDAAKTEPGFEEDYKKDAVGAIEKHIGALKDRLLGFRLTAKGNEMSYDYDRNYQPAGGNNDPRNLLESLR